ncbi:MAG: nitroreductase family protein, partial [Lysobacteraceae bacterium]
MQCVPRGHSSGDPADPPHVRVRLVADPVPTMDTLRDLVALAVYAPSSHNTQPWRFRLAPASIDLLADRTRALPVNDPFDRELVISC